MKSHQSHDILLLCPACHEVSNCHDLQLRKKLAELCDAPLSGTLSHICDKIPQGWKMVQSAVKILRNETTIPQERRKELEIYVSKFTGYQKITSELLNFLYEQLLVKITKRNNSFQNHTHKYISLTQTKCQPHGLKV
jgi:hypothetical protein